MEKPSFSMTNDTIMVVVNGVSYVVRKGQPNFEMLRGALRDQRWHEVPNHLKVKNSLQAWAQGRFTIDGDVVSYNGTPLPASLNQRIVAMATKGESPMPFFNFWEKLQKNPSYRSVQQLWGFLDRKNIPLTADGCFLAYKGLNDNYTDCHTGTVDNHPGVVNKMPRNEISDDPNETCHVGYHVGSKEYASSFAQGRMVICKVDPENVVCVPKDESFGKMRVCEYEVVGNYGNDLSSTVHEDEESEVENTEPEIDEESEGVCTVCEGITETVDTLKVPKRYAKYQKLDSAELLKLSIEKLREYAYRGLKIVGATKIAGGKLKLIARIMDVRNGTHNKGE